MAAVVHVPSLEEGVALLVKLEPNLPISRQNGLFHAIRLHPGVTSVTDLSAISQETLNKILLLPELPNFTKRKRDKKLKVKSELPQLIEIPQVPDEPLIDPVTGEAYETLPLFDQ